MMGSIAGVDKVLGGRSVRYVARIVRGLADSRRRTLFVPNSEVVPWKVSIWS
jgi:hypothetical protein